MTGTVASFPRRPLVVALIRDREGQARIAEALRERADFVAVDTLDALEIALRRHAATVRVVIATPYDCHNAPVAPALSRLRSFAPAAPLIGYFRNGYSEEQEILAFARANMNGMAFRHVTDTRITLAAVISRSMHSSVAEEVMAVVRPHLQRDAERFVAYGVQHAYEQVGVEELASAFGRHRKTIAEYCAAADLPGPAALLTWCRFFVFGYHLDHGTASIEDLCETLDFPSPSALRTQLKRYTGRRPLELRSLGALRTILAAFLQPNAIGREARAVPIARPRPRALAARPRGRRHLGVEEVDGERSRHGGAEGGEAVG